MLAMKIVGVGASVPSTGTSNDELEAKLGLTPGWIAKRAGIYFRPSAPSEWAVSDLAVAAGSKALAAAGIPAEKLGLVLLATSTPDHLLPPSSPLVAHQLGARHAGAIDLTGACAGFLYGLVMGSASGQAMHRPVLLIGANILTRRVDPGDANTVVLFGDGAGAVVLTPSDDPHLLGFYLGADGSQYDAIKIPAGGSREPLTAESLAARRNRMEMQSGSGLFRHSIRMMADAGRRALLAAGVQIQEIDWWIPHQANYRVIRETGNILGIEEGRTLVTLDRYANSSAATIPIAFSEGIDAGKIRPGQTLLLTSVGAGMTCAGVVMKAS
jgi:3-oxoacyl-[acyl-carrier-protein] synthase III